MPIRFLVTFTIEHAKIVVATRALLFLVSLAFRFFHRYSVFTVAVEFVFANSSREVLRAVANEI